MKNQVKRNPKGSAIVQGVVGLWLLIVATVLGTLLLINVGGATYGKEKLGFITDQAAMYASNLPPGAGRQAAVTNLVNSLLGDMGFGTNNTSITITDTSVSGQPAVQVTVSTSLATLLAGKFASVIPSQFSTPYTSTSVKNTWFNGYATSTNLIGAQVTGPVVNTTLAFPKDGLPHYVTTIFGMNQAP